MAFDLLSAPGYKVTRSEGSPANLSMRAPPRVHQDGPLSLTAMGPAAKSISSGWELCEVPESPLCLLCG